MLQFIQDGEQINPLYYLLKGTDESYANLSPILSLILPTTNEGLWGKTEIFTCGDLVKYELKNTLYRIKGFTFSNEIILDVFQADESEIEYGMVGMTVSSACGLENVTRERLLAEKQNDTELLMHKDGLLLFQ